MSLHSNLLLLYCFSLSTHRCFSWGSPHWKANFTASEKTSRPPSSHAGMRAGTRLCFLCLSTQNDLSGERRVAEKLKRSWSCLGVINAGINSWCCLEVQLCTASVWNTCSGFELLLKSKASAEGAARGVLGVCGGKMWFLCWRA